MYVECMDLWMCVCWSLCTPDCRACCGTADHAHGKAVADETGPGLTPQGFDRIEKDALQSNSRQGLESSIRPAVGPALRWFVVVETPSRHDPTQNKLVRVWVGAVVKEEVCFSCLVWNVLVEFQKIGIEGGRPRATAGQSLRRNL